MSGTTLDTSTPTRRPRGDRPERAVHREEDAEPQVTIGAGAGDGGTTPDDALAESRRLLIQAGADRDAATARANAAEAARLQAEKNATTSRVSDRQSAVSANLEAGKSEASAAKAAYAQARESGDVAAELAAQELLGFAISKIHESNRELEWLKNQAEQANAQSQQTQQQQAPQPSAATQKWYDDHPRFFSDSNYQTAVVGLAHKAALSGKREGSQEYIDEVESGLDALFGEGHGRVGGERSRNVERDDQPMRGSEGMRPSGGSDRGGAGWTKASLPIGHNGSQLDIRYRGPPNDRRIEILGHNQKENLENIQEGARTTNSRLYEQNPSRAIAEYVNEYIEAAEEGFQDLKRGDGQGWR